MANYIKIPLAINPARSFVVGALNNVAAATGGGTVSGTGATAVIAGNISTSGSGSGVTVSVTKGADATIQTATITVTGAGEGYKVGDTITIAADTTASTTQWTEAIVYTIVATDLVTVEGSTTNSFQLVPVDNVAFVKPVSATSAEIVTNLWDATAGRSLKWTVTVDNEPASTEAQLAADLAEAINKASQAENDVPTVSFYNDAEVLTVVYS